MRFLKGKSSHEVLNKKVVLIGGAGWPNYGDELILDAWKRFLIDNKLAKEIYFFEGTTNSAKKLHNHDKGDVKLYFRNDLERIAQSVKNKSFWEQVVRGYNFISNQGFDRYQDVDFTVFKEADIIHLHGGGYLNDFWPERGFFLGFAAALNKEFEVKVVATGIGLGPVKKIPEFHKDIIKEIFSCFTVFEMRDIDGFRSLRKEIDLPHIIYGLDDCFLKSIGDICKKKETGKRTLFLSMLNNSIKKIPDVFWSEVRLYAKNFDDVVFFESSPEQDRIVVDFIQSKIGPVKVQKVEDSIKEGVMVGIRDEVICSRFHVHFIFARYGIKGWYSSHNQDARYYDVKHQSIIDRGSSFIYTNFNSLPLKNDKRVSFICNSDKKFHEEKQRLAKEIYSV